MFGPEAPREMMPTDAMMKFYNCSDFPFNFNFIVDLTVLTLLDDLTGELKVDMNALGKLLCLNAHCRGR